MISYLKTDKDVDGSIYFICNHKTILIIYIPVMPWVMLRSSLWSFLKHLIHQALSVSIPKTTIKAHWSSQMVHLSSSTPAAYIKIKEYTHLIIKWLIKGALYNFQRLWLNTVFLKYYDHLNSLWLVLCILALVNLISMVTNKRDSREQCIPALVPHACTHHTRVHYKHCTPSLTLIAKHTHTHTHTPFYGYYMFQS